MPQDEICDYLEKHPRATMHEIAADLKTRISKISSLISKMINKDILIDLPTDDEKKKVLKKYPSLKYSPNFVVYYLKWD